MDQASSSKQSDDAEKGPQKNSWKGAANTNPSKSSVVQSGVATPTGTAPRKKQQANAAKSSQPKKAQSNGGNVQGGKENQKKDEKKESVPVQRKKSGRLQHKQPPAAEPTRKMGVGKIHFDKDNVLGFGSHGTVVFRGTFDGRPGQEIAVKRVQIQFDISREVDIMNVVDHKNVIRYFCVDSDVDFRYLVLELCAGSLFDYVEKKMENVLSIQDSIMISSKEILRQTSEGLAHLHKSEIVHRDLKPKNVLLSTSGRGETIVKLCDFGISKKVSPGKASVTMTGIMGTEGWIAPEVLKSESASYPMDIFALGCLFYYVLTGGSHPYGEALHRNSNIINGQYSLSGIATKEENESFHLISLAISSSPSLRPAANGILSHPFFWDSRKKLDFFCEVSDRLTIEPGPTSILMERLEKNESQQNYMNWPDKICERVMEDLRKLRDYKENSVRDLLRAIRNIKHHYWERPKSVRQLIGEFPHDLLLYFTNRFPGLLLYAFEAMKLCSEEAVFFSYYSDEDRLRTKKYVEEMEKKTTEEKKNEPPASSAKAVADNAVIEKESPLSELEEPCSRPGLNNLQTIPDLFVSPHPQEKKASESAIEAAQGIDRPMEEEIARSEGKQATPIAENWVGKLSEFSAQNKLSQPEYEYDGPDETKMFSCHASLSGLKESGRGMKKKQAKSEAARKLFAAVQEQVEILREATQLVRKGTEMDAIEVGEDFIQGAPREAAIDASLAYTDPNPHKAVEMILSDTTRFRPEFSLQYREIEELSTQGFIQTYLSVQFTIIRDMDSQRRFFCGEGMDVQSARDEAARAAFLHFLTYLP